VIYAGHSTSLYTTATTCRSADEGKPLQPEVAEHLEEYSSDSAPVIHGHDDQFPGHRDLHRHSDCAQRTAQGPLLSAPHGSLRKCNAATTVVVLRIAASAGQLSQRLGSATFLPEADRLRLSSLRKHSVPFSVAECETSCASLRSRVATARLGTGHRPHAVRRSVFGALAPTYCTPVRQYAIRGAALFASVWLFVITRHSRARTSRLFRGSHLIPRSCLVLQRKRRKPRLRTYSHPHEQPVHNCTTTAPGASITRCPLWR